MLEQIGAAPGHHSELDWPQLWRASAERREIRHQLDAMAEELPKIGRDISGGDPNAKNKFATEFTYQTYLVTRRCFEQYWRTPSYLYSKFALCIFPVSLGLVGVGGWG